jgi:hypothetical protein
LEPTYSAAWLETFGRPDEATTAQEVYFLARILPLEHKRVDGNRLRTRLDYPDGRRDTFEWRLYEPEELEALGAAVGLRLDAVGAGFSEKRPTGDAPRVQYVFLRET